MTPDQLTFAMTSFATVLAIVDPFAAAPIFLAITPNDTEESRRRMARLAAIVCAGVLLVFAFTGNMIFGYFGISTPAFRVAGGILLLVLALDMMRSKEGPKPQTAEEKQESLDKADVAVTPLAIPLLAGPGAISTVALLGTHAQGMEQRLAVAAAIVMTSIISWLVLANSSALIRVIGQIGMKIVTRIMGLLLAGIGAEFILHGVREFWRSV